MARAESLSVVAEIPVSPKLDDAPPASAVANQQLNSNATIDRRQRAVELRRRQLATNQRYDKVHMITRSFLEKELTEAKELIASSNRFSIVRGRDCRFRLL